MGRCDACVDVQRQPGRMGLDRGCIVWPRSAAELQSVRCQADPQSQSREMTRRNLDANYDEHRMVITGGADVTSILGFDWLDLACACGTGLISAILFV